MIARKCDRCGAFYVPTNEGRIFEIYKQHVHANVLLDLCPKCNEDLTDFMANPDMVPVYFKCQKEEESSIE